MSRIIEAFELSAYVDGDLTPERMAEIEAAAARDPGLRRHLDELLADHRALRELAQIERAGLGTVPSHLSQLAERLSATLQAPGEDRAQGSRDRGQLVALASAAWRQGVALTAAAAVGWAAASWAAPNTDPMLSFIDEAAEVHQTAALAPAFSREPSAAVIDSVGRLFAHNLTPPDLTASGFELSRVDVAATDTGPAVVFFYTDPEVRRLSLVLSLDSPTIDTLGRDDAAPRVTTHDGLAVAYGQRRGVAYALVGSIPEPNALQLAARAALSLN